MEITIDDYSAHPVTIHATDDEAQTIIQALESAAEYLRKIGHELPEAQATPFLESSVTYANMADRMRDDID